MVTRRSVVKGLALTPVVGAALWRAPLGRAHEAGNARVGSKNFPEALIIGEMYALLLENAGLEVERKLNLGGTVVAHEALLNDEIDLYPEYTGTGLLVVLGKSVADVPGLAPATPGATASPAAGAVDAVYEYVKQQYEEQFDLVWLDQTPMNDSQALAVKREFAEEHGLRTISDLWALAATEDLTISAPVDFEEREDGLKGLLATYGEVDIAVNGVDPGIKYQALMDGDAEVVLAFSTDAEIAFNDLVVLEDDKGLWPPYHVAPVVRRDALDANPQIADALNAMAPLLTTERMIALNGMVVGEQKMEPIDVARRFLQEQGLIPQ